MQTLTTLKEKSQESFSHLVELGKQQPEEVRTWGLTAGAAVVGALTLSAVAKGVLAVIATLANPPVALGVGAVAGGLLGWTFMQKPATETAAAEASVAATVDTPAVTAAAPDAV